jgi:hypothetical protein
MATIRQHTDFDVPLKQIERLRTKLLNNQMGTPCGCCCTLRLRVFIPQFPASITILSYHHNLVQLEKFKMRRERHFLWNETIVRHRIRIQYLPGTQNKILDALSRPGRHTESQITVIWESTNAIA